MELLDKKVYRLDIGDYYCFIDNGGFRHFYGCSQSSRDLFKSACDYARTNCNGEYRVYVFCRSSLGSSPCFVCDFGGCR